MRRELLSKVWADGYEYTYQELANLTGLGIWTIRQRVKTGWSGEDILALGTNVRRLRTGHVDVPGTPGSRSWHLPLDQDPHGRAAIQIAEDLGGMTLDMVGALMGITRERVRQIEASAIRKVRLRRSAMRGRSE